MNARTILESETAREFFKRSGKAHPVSAVDGLIKMGWKYLNSEDLGDDWGTEYSLELPNIYVRDDKGEDHPFKVKAFVRKVGYDAVLFSILTGGLLPALSTAGYWAPLQPVIEEWQSKMKRQPPGMLFHAFEREWKELKKDLHTAAMSYTP